MRFALTWMSALMMLGVCGCASRGNVEMLESRLRVQENHLRQAQRELDAAQSELVVARREVDSLRGQLEQQHVSIPSPEQLRSFSRAEGIVISKLLSGGLDTDGQPGHDVFNTVLTPVDSHGELSKVTGTIRLELLDLAQDGEQRQLGVWEFSDEEAEKRWKKTLFGSGYTFQLPWKEPPLSHQVTLHARLTTTDGRQFDATQELKVTPPTRLALGESEPLRSTDFPKLRTTTPEPSAPGNRSLRPATTPRPASARPRAVPPSSRPRATTPDEGKLVPPPEALDIPEVPAIERSGHTRLSDDFAPPEAPEPRRTRARQTPIPTSDRWTDESRPVLR